MSKLRKKMPPPTTRIPDKKKEENINFCRKKMSGEKKKHVPMTPLEIEANLASASKVVRGKKISKVQEPDKKKAKDKSYCMARIEPNSKEYCELRDKMIREHAKLYHPCKFCGGPTPMISQPCCPNCK